MSCLPFFFAICFTKYWKSEETSSNQIQIRNPICKGLNLFQKVKYSVDFFQLQLDNFIY